MKVGDYVRTNLKNEIVICKVIDIIHSKSMNDNRMVFDKPTKFTYYVEDNKNYKSSSNIIDLIEVGDYVNGSMVVNKIDDKLLITQLMLPYDLKEQDIKNVVTHEQFESMKYKVD